MSLGTIYRLSVIMRLSDLVSGPMRSARVSINDTERSLKRLQDTSRNWMASGGKMMAAGAAIGAAIAMPAKATFDTQAALGELRSVGIKDMDALTKAGRDFSNQWAGTTTSEFVSAAYDIKSGISDLTDTGVAEFTTMSALTAKATKSTVDDMTSLFATAWGIYRDMYSQLSDEAFGQMFAGGVAAAVQQFKTTGPEMSSAISSLGAAATTAKRPLEEQMAILGELQATMSGSEAGTKYRSFIQNAVRAGERLEMSFVDQNGELLGMVDIMRELQKRYGDSLNAMQKEEISRAFGTQEAVQLIDMLFPMIDDLEDSILSVQGSMKGGTEVVKEMANEMNIDPGSQWQILIQQLQNLREIIGEQMLDDMQELMSSAQGVIGRVTEWVEANPELVRSIGRVASALAGFLIIGGGGIVVVASLINGVARLGRTVLGAVRNISNLGRAVLGARSHLETLRIRGMYAADTLRTGFGHVRRGAATAGRGILTLGGNVVRMGKQAAIAAAGGVKRMTLGLVGMAKQGIMAAVKALPGLIAGVWSFTAALLANPITWIVIAIIGLIAILVLLWRNWDKVTAAFSAGWEWLKEMFSLGREWVSEALNNMVTTITDTFGRFREAGAALLDAFVEGIKSMVMKPYEVVKGGLSKLRNLLPFSDAREGPLSTLTKSGMSLVDTFSSGIMKRRSSLSSTMARVLNTVNFDPWPTPQPAGPGGGGPRPGAPPPGMMPRSSFSIRELFRERDVQREKEVEHDRSGPLVALHYHGGSRKEAEDLASSLEEWLSRNR